MKIINLLALKLQPERFTQPLVIVGLCVVVIAIVLAVFAQSLAEKIVSRNAKKIKNNSSDNELANSNQIDDVTEEKTNKHERKAKIAEYKVKIKYISLAIAFAGCIVAVLGAN